MIARDPKTGRASITHGMHKTRFYNIWCRVKTRTLNSQYPEAKYYKNRGITICKEWITFENFKNDMYEDYLIHVKKFGENKTQIDRANVDSGYFKSNCRWVTPKLNSSNRRSNVFITRDGETKTLKQWTELLNLKYQKVWDRINILDWSIERALS